MTIHVVPTEFATVQAAIDAAVEGDSIQILAGTFDGFNVTKERLKIFGCGIGKTIIAGNSAFGSTDGINVDASRTILKGFTIQGFQGTDSDGIDVNTNNNILVELESKSNFSDGFEIDGENNLIINCLASSNLSEGFDLENDHNCVINCKSIQNGAREGEGIEIEANYNKLINNLAKENFEDGFDLDDNASFNTLFGNVSIKNMGDGIEVDDEANNNNIIANMVCNNIESGIEMEANGGATIGNVIDSNIIRNNGPANVGSSSGIFVQDGVIDSSIRFNKLKLNEPFDIDVEGDVNDNTFDGNICENSFPDNLCT
ncbi:right-handed parallel beta-helix repeat-containing protein [Bacillus solimangrovi]|uniref:Right handed beta helix domain-containing protein n=1 Tax=Bacillus solimangrovi TaxID=1305675 RepID=A0A1E5LDC4_9BACI|nr:right-handed parallel beta-helix repeat-containing protein [Bacillus solimangrovi]OEH92039.1 hypothetical protein BFG57_17115 [Bacillus solimangrovi]